MRLARVALAALASVAIARQDYACREDVCFYHVPKTGGDSFKYLLRDELKAHGKTFWSNEWCPRQSNGTSGGDSPYRKGFYDAMLAGCIPKVKLPAIFMNQRSSMNPAFFRRECLKNISRDNEILETREI